jgi:hypothetical protein
MTRVCVAIVSGPGIGKSSLLRQFADLNHNGAYREREEGAWDPRPRGGAHTDATVIGLER